MRTPLIILLLILIQNISAAQEKKVTAGAGLSINVSDLKWSIAGNIQGESPNILSELIFNSVTSMGYFLQASYKPLEQVELSVHYQSNETITGHGTDIDYQNDNRKNPTYNLSFHSNRGELNIFRTGIDVPLIKKKNMILSTGFGYRLNFQSFYILRDDNSELESTYKVNTKGAEINIDAILFLSSHLSTTLYLNGGYVNYTAKANWNLQSIFMHPLSFMQTSRGITTGGGIDFGVKVRSNLAFYIVTGYDRTNVLKGIDTSYLATGLQVSTQLNGVDITRFHTKLGITISL